MASRFWVGGAGTWDGSSTTNWAATSGGAGGQSVPGAADDVTFDGSSGGGTVTVNTNFSINGLTSSAHTGTLDFATNNNSPTIGNGGWTNNGTATRTVSLGSGTFSINCTNSNAWTWTTTTNLTLTPGTATLAFSGNTNNTRTINLGSTTLSYPTITIAANSNYGHWIFSSNPGTNPTITIAAMSVAAPNYLDWNGFGVYVMTAAPTFTGSSSSALIYVGPADEASSPTIQTANAVSGSWMGLRGLTFTGGGSATFTNSFDFRKNTISGGGTLSITAPSVGGSGGGQRVISG